MPMKFGKAFQRRKSSGNALDEIQTPVEPAQQSFRVFERPKDGRKSFDATTTMSRMSDARPHSDGQFRDYAAGRPVINLNRYDHIQPLGQVTHLISSSGSGGTQNSSSSGGNYDTSSSSARYSSSSTLPSSSSLEGAHEDPHTHPRGHNVPLPPAPTNSPGFSLRNAGRAFSFGAKKATQMREPPLEHNPMPQQSNIYTDIPDVDLSVRPRAMTEASYASASTATPPKLRDEDLKLTFSDDPDGFGNMFAGLDSRDEKPLTSSSPGQNFGSVTLTSPLHELWSDKAQLDRSSKGEVHSTRSPFNPPPPLLVDRTSQVSPAPYSAKSHNSRDGLMTASPVQEQGGFGFQDRPGPSYARPRLSNNSPNSASRASIIGLRRNTGNRASRTSQVMEDPDHRLVAKHTTNSVHTSSSNSRDASPSIARKAVPAPQPNHPQPLDRRPVTLYDGDNQDHGQLEYGASSESITSTPKAKKFHLEDRDDALIGDQSFKDLALSAALYESGHTGSPRGAPPVGGKVMTPAQFERYKKEQELRRSGSGSAKDDEDDSSEDNYEEEDEAERNRQMAKQRQRQEAQMSVYRQQMMKVTGEQQPLSGVPSRPEISRTSQSTPNLTNLTGKMSTINLGENPDPTAKSSEDEDDDIPLGILAAHGFPSKERPPSHLNRMGSQPNIRYTSEAYPPPPPPPQSVAGGGGKNIPVFARNLPKELPYFGAGLVNPSNRESLAFGSGSQSVYGGSQATGARQEPPPPGGLVGIIAKEERARAMRRGSPNAQTFDGPGMASGAVSPEAQAQMQMNQQMAQMMQMQMQWMQQMMAMQGLPPMPPMPGMPQLPMPGMPNQMPPGGFPPSPNGPRPGSMGKPVVGGGLMPPQQQGRAMSMLGPDMQAQWNAQNRMSMAPSFAPSFNGQRPGSVMQQQGMNARYAPSMVPSERSTVGQPSRYRPVSIMPEDNKTRSSTMMSGSILKNWDSKNRASTMGLDANRNIPSVRAVGKADDEDEDEGWAEMKKKKENKRSLWRGRKKGTEGEKGLEGIFIPMDQ